MIRAKILKNTEKKFVITLTGYGMKKYRDIMKINIDLSLQELKNNSKTTLKTKNRNLFKQNQLPVKPPVLALDLEGVHDVKLHHPSSYVATSNQ